MHKITEQRKQEMSTGIVNDLIRFCGKDDLIEVLAITLAKAAHRTSTPPLPVVKTLVRKLKQGI